MAPEHSRGTSQSRAARVHHSKRRGNGSSGRTKRQRTGSGGARQQSGRGAAHARKGGGALLQDEAEAPNTLAWRPRVGVPRTKREERRMLQRALAASAAEARSAIEAAEGGQLGQQAAGRRAPGCCSATPRSETANGAGPTDATCGAAAAAPASDACSSSGAQSQTHGPMHSVHLLAAAAAVVHARAAALAARDASDSEGEGPVERCMILGCRRQLLACYGVKEDCSSVRGRAELPHLICAPCLSRWFRALNQLRAAKGLEALVRRSCPVCKCELRHTVGQVRADADKYHLGLLKIESSWDCKVCLPSVEGTAL